VSWDIQAPADSSVPFVSCDVSSEAKVAAALSETVGKLGAAPSVLINNCGLQYMAPVTEFPLEKWNQLLGIMVTGTFLCSKAVIPGECVVVRGRSPAIANLAQVCSSRDGAALSTFLQFTAKKRRLSRARACTEVFFSFCVHLCNSKAAAM
jgi:NAD(P)-dependent dehydrogenase (short-subunit alcohol dehydrogenase family)